MYDPYRLSTFRNINPLQNNLLQRNICIALFVSGVTTEHQVVACLDPISDVTLTCPSSHYIKIKSSFLHKRWKQTADFCEDPTVGEDCNNNPVAVYNHFLHCQTLSTCTRSMPADVFQPDVNLEECIKKHNYSGEEYLAVSYECIPRKSYHACYTASFGSVIQHSIIFGIS